MWPLKWATGLDRKTGPDYAQSSGGDCQPGAIPESDDPRRILSDTCDRRFPVSGELPKSIVHRVRGGAEDLYVIRKPVLPVPGFREESGGHEAEGKPTVVRYADEYKVNVE